MLARLKVPHYIFLFYFQFSKKGSKIKKQAKNGKNCVLGEENSQVDQITEEVGGDNVTIYRYKCFHKNET